MAKKVTGKKPAAKKQVTKLKTPLQIAKEKEKEEQELLEGFEYVCLEIEKGHALRNIVGSFMGSKKFFQMLDSSETLRKRYARACEMRADSIAEDIIDISDASNADLIIGEKGNLIIDGEAVSRSRLKVEARKWILSKLHPKKYGDKVELDHKSTDGSMSPPTPINFTKGST
jgi:hypothetical protein